MKRTIIRSCVCVVTFVAALIVSSMLLNRGNTDMTADMEPPRLPSVYVDADGLRVNMMDGYLGEMEEEYMRGRLLPIGTDRKLSIGILTYGTQVESLAFEVRSADGTRLVEDTQVSGMT